jgi:hypothetical protein
MATPEDFTLSPAFAAVAASRLDVSSLVAAADTVARVPRLLVPIDVQGLRVTPVDEIEHADIATTSILDDATTEGQTPGEAGATAPDPFSDVGTRAPGVYVHWAVPDALTRGIVTEENDHELRPISDVEFLALPNRWCVTRFWWAGSRYRTRSWIVESDRSRLVELEEWAEAETLPADADADTPTVEPGELTAVMGGDAAWFAIYDNVENRFAFRDDVADLAGVAGTVHYSVAGWYSVPSLDPMAGNLLLRGFHDRLEELRWIADLSDLPAATTSTQVLTDQIAQIDALRRGTTEAKTGLVLDHSELNQPAASVLGGAGAVIKLPKPTWPQQSIYHGTLYSVPLSGSGFDPKPSADAIEVGIGGTSSEALSSLMAESVDEQEDGAREQLLNALQYGIIAELETPDGPARLNEETHRRAFESQPGGFTTERIRDGDPFAHLRTPSGTPTSPPYLSTQLDDAKVLSDRGVVLDFVNADRWALSGLHESLQPTEAVVEVDNADTVEGAGSGPHGTFLDPPPFLSTNVPRAESRIDALRDAADTFVRAKDPVLRPRPDKGIEFRTVRRALPRLFQPQDPVASLRGAGRTLRHHSDDRYDEDGRLVCRLSTTEVRELPGLVPGRHLLESPLFAASIPSDVQDLLDEAVLNVPKAVDQLVSVIRQRTAGVEQAAVKARLEAEDRLFVNYLVPGTSAHELLDASMKVGTLPSPKAITLWHQAWEPMYLEWELDVQLDTDRERWRLTEIDVDPASPLSDDEEVRLVSGRALLSRAAATSISELLAEFIDEEENLDRGETTIGVIGDDALDDLRDLNADARDADVLHASFDGLRDWLLGFDTNVRYTEADTEGEILPQRLPELLRAGRATVTRLRVVDAFGRYVDLAAPFSVADDLEVQTDDGDDPDTFLLRPRILAPTRLWFRFVDATDDTRDALVDQESKTVSRNPVAGWLLPDHVDGALEVFDPTGEPLGQLRNERLGSGVVWEGSPGRPGPMGRPPFMDIANPHTEKFARELIERDAAERQAATEQKESTLDALLRAIDTTLWTVDPFADSGLDYYAKMTGRPIAVVRARVLLDVVSDFDLFAEGDPRRAERKARYDELSQSSFEVRLGALTKIDDGLLGFFLNDDYRELHPVHSSVRDEALASGPHRGFLGSRAEVAEFAADQPIDPITHPYVVPETTIRVQPGHPVRLTLLLDPGARVHATCGIVPRKSIGLPRAFVEAALARIAPSFRFGPVLVDPGVIRMPKPSVLPEDQVWTRRDTPTSWRDDPIEAATQFAYLPDVSHEAQEGYIRIRLDP